nr:7819_t:CDS:10 [Entrophospora candida]
MSVDSCSNLSQESDNNNYSLLSSSQLSETLMNYDKNITEIVASLPVDVKEFLSKNEKCEGVLNFMPEYATVFSDKQCLVWKYQKEYKRYTARSVSYKLEMPLSLHGQQRISNLPRKLPFVTFITNYQQLGLLASTPTGEFRYWNDLSKSMFDGIHYKELQADTQSRKGNLAIFGTKKGMLYQVFLVNSTGKSVLEYTQLYPKTTTFRPLSYLWSSSDSSSPNTTTNTTIKGKVISSTLTNFVGTDFRCELILLKEIGIENWMMGVHDKSSYNYLLGQEIYKTISKALLGNESLHENMDLDIKLIDIVYARTNRLRSYSLVILSKKIEADTESTTYDIIRYQNVNYSTTVLLSEETDIIMGCCAEGSKSLFFKEDKDESQILFLTAKNGIMRCKLNIAELRQESQGLELGSKDEEIDIENLSSQKTQNLKQKLEQVIYNKIDENLPVYIALPADFEGDLDIAISELSDDIVKSGLKYFDDIIDLKSQLNERYNKLNMLIDLINKSGLSNKLHLSTRNHLFCNSEKIATASKLWMYHNSLILSYGGNEKYQFVLEELKEAIENYNIQEIGSIFSYFQDIIKNTSITDEKIILTYEINKILLTSFDAAFNFRKDSMSLYSLNSYNLNLSESWTCKGKLFDNKNKYNSSNNKVEKKLNEMTNEEFKEQLVGLVSYFLATTIQHLKIDDFIIQSQAMQYHNEWTDVLKRIAKIGKAEKAILLAEEYDDFKALVNLIFEFSQNIKDYNKKYLIKYKKKYAYRLYEWFIENENYAELFEQEYLIEDKDWLEDFLKDKNLKEIAWLHYIKIEKYKEASTDLLKLSQRQKNSDEKKVIRNGENSNYDDTAVSGKIILFSELKSRNRPWIRRNTEKSKTIEISGDFSSENSMILSTIKVISNEKPALAQLFVYYASRLLRGATIPTDMLIELATLRDIKEKEELSMIIQVLTEDSNEINEILEDTIIYYTFDQLKNFKSIKDWYCSPGETFFSSTYEQLSRKFPDFSQDLINGLIQDFNQENNQLKIYIEDYDLINYVEKIIKLLEY